MQAFIEKDDEVILIEPYFDIFKPSVEVCGGKTVSVTLKLERKFDSKISANNWKLDISELRAKISPKTKAIIINTPHNPTGKVFDGAEQSAIAQVAIENNLLVISDEVVSFLDCVWLLQEFFSMTIFSTLLRDQLALPPCRECGIAH